jgi:hypothetical protein
MDLKIMGQKIVKKRNQTLVFAEIAELRSNHFGRK